MAANVILFDPPLWGEIEQPIAPAKRGRVKAMGTHWFAECYGWNYRQTLEPGQLVMVIARRGSTLLVMPIQNNGLE